MVVWRGEGGELGGFGINVMGGGLELILEEGGIGDWVIIQKIGRGE